MSIKLIYPLDPGIIITQLFGGNSAFYSDPKYGGIKGHNGIDFLTTHGQPVYATHDGVAEYQVDSSGGHGVVIMSKGKDYKTIYWHLCDPIKEPKFASPVANKSISVETGDLIGYADNTGASTGDHLHFGLKLCQEGFTLNQTNGYLGAVDPTPYFDKNYPVTVELLKKQIGLLQQLIELWKTLFKK
jgi:murein DD-endopeptidase MepM/ murein hydrolase activator NlpD